MTTLYIRMIPKVVADSAENWQHLSCPFALVSAAGNIQREGIAPLPELASIVPGTQHVVLLIAASDVTLLRMQVPPLSPAKLKAALPGLVEDRLIADPAECVMVAGPAVDGLRTVAVMQRDWLNTLLSTFTAYGARKVSAVPAQLCLPFEEGQASAAILQLGTESELALRMADQEGIGLAIVPDESQSMEHQVLQTLQAMVMQVPIAMYVPESQLQSYQQALEQEEGGERITVQADSWPYWVAGANHAALDLSSGMQDAGGSRIDWKKWRWPVVLGSAFLLVNILALNIDWWRLRNEADQLRASMTQIYRATFPKDPVIVDPLAQMRQKLGANRRGGSPEDFTSLAAIVAEELNGLAQSKSGSAAPGIAGLEYKERSLTVKFKPGSDVPADQMKAALARRNLELIQGPSQGGGTVWQIRSTR